jgi:ABC-type Fe3+-siderophore transport system permease subunit
MAFYRLRLFYGWIYALTSLALLAWFFWRRGKGVHPLALPLALAASGAYLGMNFLRAGLGATHIFQFSKDDLVILPVVTLLLGSLLSAMWEKGAIPRVFALALLLGWVGFGLVSLSRDVRGRFLRPEYPPSPGSGGQVQEANTTRFPPARLAW